MSKKRIHILGICGTLMAGVARLAKELNYTVSGSDKMLAPPMSDQLNALGIKLDDNMQSPPQNVDTILTGNILSRGQTIVETLLEQKLNYQSAPDWLYQNILHSRPVIAVTGTHGKTTTTSMIAWILEYHQHQPGFLIGGVAENFGVSSRLGNEKAPFVIEADEYDTAFFDKRPKFLHYQPNILIINNLEFDHADIYLDLAAIQKQFHYLLRQLPSTAKIIYPNDDTAIHTVMQQGCWSEQITLGNNGQWQLQHEANGTITILHQQKIIAQGKVPLSGEHNRKNILSAIVACHQIGIAAKKSLLALQHFKGIKRRLEIKRQWQKQQQQLRLIDDFAHHPTAIKLTLQTLKNESPPHHSQTTTPAPRQVIALLDITSNSMRQGAHKHLLAQSLEDADTIFVWQNQNIQWDVNQYLQSNALKNKLHIHQDIDEMIHSIIKQTQSNAQNSDFVMLSNGTFGGLSQKLIQQFDALYKKL